MKFKLLNLLAVEQPDCLEIIFIVEIRFDKLIIYYLSFQSDRAFWIESNKDLSFLILNRWIDPELL